MYNNEGSMWHWNFLVYIETMMGILMKLPKNEVDHSKQFRLKWNNKTVYYQ